MTDGKEYHIPLDETSVAAEPNTGLRPLTREEAMSRFMAAKARKKAIIAEMEIEMKAEYEKKTGLKANYFSAMWKIWILNP